MMAFLELVSVVIVVGHLVVCPYTKVEESFNLQAIHDVLVHKSNISSYDHLEFPGVVPRTFLGPLLISVISSPVYMVTQMFGISIFMMQYIVRGCLGLCVLLTFFKFCWSVKQHLGRNVACWTMMITASQFHFMFYASRPLPNSFALIIVLMAVSWWLEQKHAAFIWSSAFAILVFRAELAIFLGLMLLIELFSRRLSLLKLIPHGCLATIIWLSVSVSVDSYFWQRWLWPEGEVLWYNTVLNKSSNWGTSPFSWYFYSALPRALGTSLIFIAFGAWWDRRSFNLLLPSVGFVLIYSILPHKELRFIIYTFPVFNAVAAMGCSRIWNNKNKSRLNQLMALVAVGHLLANIVLTSGFLYLSHINYPGGAAIHKLHTVEDPKSAVHVHIDVMTAQTGVSRFTEQNPNWIYNKTEELEPGGSDMMSYSHLLLDVADAHHYAHTHNILATIEGFSRIQIQLNKWPYVHLLEPKIHLLKKNVKPIR